MNLLATEHCRSKKSYVLILWKSLYQHPLFSCIPICYLMPLWASYLRKSALCDWSIYTICFPSTKSMACISGKLKVIDSKTKRASIGQSNHVESDGCTMPWKSFNMQDYYASSGYKNAICVFFPSHERKMALLHIFYLQPIKTVSILLNWWKNGGAGKGDNAFVVLDLKAKTSPALWTKPTVAQGTESECGYRTLLMGKKRINYNLPLCKVNLRGEILWRWTLRITAATSRGLMILFASASLRQIPLLL
jgi:hypothetical protein